MPMGNNPGWRLLHHRFSHEGDLPLGKQSGCWPVRLEGCRQREAVGLEDVCLSSGAAGPGERGGSVLGSFVFSRGYRNGLRDQ